MHATRLFFVFLFFAHSVSAQSYYFRRYEVESGLSNATVYCAIQDKQGFMWFGTKDGIDRFDGYRFRTLNVYAGEIAHNSQYTYCLAMDSSGTIWAGTGHGIYRYDQQNERFVPFIDSFAFVRALQFDKRGRLWVSANGSLYRYDFGAKTLSAFPSPRYFTATSFYEAQDGMWISSGDGRLQKMDLVSDSFVSYDLFAHSPKEDPRVITKIVPDGKGGIFIGTVSGIKRFDMQTAAYTDILRLDSGNSPVYVRDILRAGPSEFWFGTESGIYILNTLTGGFTNLKNNGFNPYSLSGTAVYALYKDAEQGIWAGTYFGGVSYYPRHVTPFFEKYFPDGSRGALSGYAVRDICKDRQGKLWIGTEDAGLNRLYPATGEIKRFTPSAAAGSISNSNIQSLLVVDDDLWIGTFRHGLDLLDTRTGKVTRHIVVRPKGDQQASSLVICMLQAKNRDIYLGTADALYRYDRQKSDFVPPANFPTGLEVTCLVEDHEGTIWAGTYFGVYFINPRTGLHGHLANEPANVNSIGNNSINAVFEDTFHCLWFGTNGGLCRLDPSRTAFTRYTANNGMPGNFVFKILADDAENLWVTTSKGLVNLDRNRNIAAIYTRSNGLLTDQFNYNSGYKDAGGKLYFGSIRGLIAFRPDTAVRGVFIPPLYVTGMQVDNRELEIGRDSTLKQSLLTTTELRLTYDRSSFSVDFAALSFTSPGMTAYRYKLEGLDRQWTVLPRNRKVYYTHLAPGVYTFRIRAASKQFLAEPEKALVIEVLPPWWATWWAYGCYALAAGLLAYYILRASRSRLRIKKEKEIYDAKITFFTHVAHEIRTPLTLIKGPLENLSELVDGLPVIRADVTTMERNTDRLVNLVNQLMDFNRIEAKGFSLDFARVDINEKVREVYTAFEQDALKRNLDYTLELPASAIYAMADAEALFKILSNLIGNAVKYADRYVKVSMRLPYPEDGSLVIQVCNDGYLIPAAMKEKIFEPFFRLKEAARQKGTGIGLALARSLTGLHKGKLFLKEPTETLNTFVLILPLK